MDSDQRAAATSEPIISPKQLNPKSPLASPAAVVAHEIPIPVESLARCITCVLCSHLLLDAVVCPCSHGFCRACIEKYHRERQLGSASCPICNITPAPTHKPVRKSGLSSRQVEHESSTSTVTLVGESADLSEEAKSKAQYIRCSQLDDAVSLLIDRSSEEEKQVRFFTSAD